MPLFRCDFFCSFCLIRNQHSGFLTLFFSFVLRKVSWPHYYSRWQSIWDRNGIGLASQKRFKFIGNFTDATRIPENCLMIIWLQNYRIGFGDGWSIEMLHNVVNTLAEAMSVSHTPFSPNHHFFRWQMCIWSTNLFLFRNKSQSIKTQITKNKINRTNKKMCIWKNLKKLFRMKMDSEMLFFWWGKTKIFVCSLSPFVRTVQRAMLY